MWTANNDARNFVVLGDPAVRLVVTAPGSDAAERPAIAPVVRQIHPTPRAEPPANRLPPVGDQPNATMTPSLSAADGPAIVKNAEPVMQTARPAECEDLLARLQTTLQRVADGTVRLEVSTYSSTDPSVVMYAELGQHPVGNAQLRARSWIASDGTTQLCLPESDGAIDEAVWAIHLAMVDRALAERSEWLKTIITLMQELRASASET